MIYVKLSTNSHLTEAIYKNSQSIIHNMTFDLCHFFLKLSEKKKSEWAFVQLLTPIRICDQPFAAKSRSSSIGSEANNGRRGGWGGVGG